MQIKTLILVGALIGSVNLAMALDNNASLVLTNSSTNNEIAINLTINNVQTIKDLDYDGLKGIDVISREVDISSNQNKSKTNTYISKLYLLPKKAGDYTIKVEAKVNGHEIKSNVLKLTVTDSELKAIKATILANEKQENKEIKKVSPKINQELKSQQQFFDNINKEMAKEFKKINL